MGTRSLTFLYEAKNEKPFVCMYRQFDGYKEGHGADLAKFLAPITLLNGYGDQKAGTHANGMGCLAAQMVTHFKGPHGIGGFYLHAPDTTDAGQEYEYHVYPDEVRVIENGYSIRNSDKTIFAGTWKEFAYWTGVSPKHVPTAPKYATLREALQHEEVQVRFQKADGSIRDMRCTTDLERIHENDHPLLSTIDAWRDKDLYKVYDLEINEWRSFREERVLAWEVVS